MLSFIICNKSTMNKTNDILCMYSKYEEFKAEKTFKVRLKENYSPLLSVLYKSYRSRMLICINLRPNERNNLH